MPHNYLLVFKLHECELFIINSKQKQDAEPLCESGSADVKVRSGSIKNNIRSELALP